MKRKAYISYSMNDGEMYILSSISKYLSAKEYFIYSSYDIPQTVQNSQIVNNQIAQCDLFIGIASHQGIKSNWVIQEWNIVQQLKKAAFFLIEDNVPLNPEFVRTNNVILFNRQFPQNSLNQLTELIEKAKNQKNAKNWIVGGLIGMAVIKMLSSKEK